MLAGLGPTFVKLGQNLGNRPDLVRADYMDELCALQDRVPPFDNSVAMAAIRGTLALSRSLAGSTHGFTRGGVHRCALSGPLCEGERQGWRHRARGGL
jgi:hypothetical protein